MDKINSWMKYAIQQALNSPDPSTQNGAVLVSNGILRNETSAWNSFPNGVYTDENRWQRPQKYHYVEHAERNAIYNAARQGISTNGSTLVCVWAACSDCARAIIQSGISELITINTNDDETDQRWKESNQFGLEMLNEVGIKIVKLDSVYGNLTPILRNGVKWLPPSS